MAIYLKRSQGRSGAPSPELVQRVAQMLEDLRTQGDDAVRRYSRELDQWDPPSFRVSEEQIAEAERQLSETFKQDVRFSYEQVRNFALRQRETLRDLEVETRPGVILGHKHVPVRRVGAYVPGGKYPLVASAIMSIATAKAAGVEKVVACAPPARGAGNIHPAMLYTMHLAGADEIYALGGVQAMAAMAYGLVGIEPVDMLVGPGNAYVAEAKRQLFGVAGIDLLAGPTEILVIADETADPVLVAADLLGQAEHGPTSPAWLVSTSEELARAVLEEISRQLETLPTRDVASQSWADYGEVVVAESPEEAVELADQYASEHVEVLTKDPDWYLERLRNYGSLFLGEETTVAYGDKVIGTNHILPTGRAARYTGGLWVGKFLKTLTYQRVTPEASREIGEVCARQCHVENMFAHEVTALLRVQRYSTGQMDVLEAHRRAGGEGGS